MRQVPKGFTIIEFMIAITLSLLVLAALTAAFVANSRSRAEIEKANEQMEAGRFALQLMTDDIEVAGFYSQFNIDIALTAEDELVLPTAVAMPAALPKPCLTAIGSPNTAADQVPADLYDAFPFHIQGYDLPDAALDDDAEAAAAGLDCLEEVDYSADIVVIRRTATCVAGDPNCAGIVGAPYFQASTCSKGNELNSAAASNYYKIAAATQDDAPVSAALTLHSRDCVTLAPARALLTHIYFVANSDVTCATASACAALGVVGRNCDADTAIDGDCIPTLKRAELGNAANPDEFTIVPLAHGIQDLQIEYGVDSSGDGAPDTFEAEPASVAAWRNVVTVRLSLLSRNSTPSRDHVDTKKYVLVDGERGPFNDGYKRHVYQTTVRLMNPAGRREQ